jgi:hypothetical protein
MEFQTEHFGTVVQVRGQEQRKKKKCHRAHTQLRCNQPLAPLGRSSAALYSQQPTQWVSMGCFRSGCLGVRCSAPDFQRVHAPPQAHADTKGGEAPTAPGLLSVTACLRWHATDLLMQLPHLCVCVR